jgi:hypothetical protein
MQRTSKLVALIITLTAAGLFCVQSAKSADPRAADDDDDNAFPVVRIAFKTSFQSKDAKVGQQLEALLKEDLVSNSELVAPTDSVLIGHVEAINRIRGRFSSRQSLSIVFDRIITPNHVEVLIEARPIQQLSIFNSTGGARQIVVGQHGDLEKAESLEVLQIPEFDLAISESALDFKNRANLRIRAGDEVSIRTQVPAATTMLSGKILKH